MKLKLEADGSYRISPFSRSLPEGGIEFTCQTCSTVFVSKASLVHDLCPKCGRDVSEIRQYIQR